MHRSVAIDPSDRRFRPFDALARLVVAVVGIAALTGPFRRTIYLTKNLEFADFYEGWRVSETSVAAEGNLRHLSNRVATKGDVIEVVTTPGGAWIEHQYFYAPGVRRIAVTDAVAAATAPPVPLILTVATVLAVLTAIHRRN